MPDETIFFSSINRVHTAMKPRVAAGQNLHVVGVLNSREYTNQKGDVRYEVVARSKTITQIGTSYNDINSVEITGTVLTDLFPTETFSVFRVGTTVLPKYKLNISLNIGTLY